eukprot:Seg955.13 transcript_id=Seg955.13/GoldUCD/mRNA.D3Y31 product="hypothetical protein" protein_id=Seg955.13/GoldUCD/D3Y31
MSNPQYDKKDLILDSLSKNDVRGGNEDKTGRQGGHDFTGREKEPIMRQATFPGKYRTARWSRFDDKPAFSYSTSLPHIDNTNATQAKRRSQSLGVNTAIRQHEVVHIRPSAAYSRHFTDEVKHNEYQSGKQGRRPVFDTEWPALPTDMRSSRNNSLLLASGTEDLWHSTRQMSSPGVQDDSESEFSSGHATPVEGHSATSARYASEENIEDLVQDDPENISEQTLDDDDSDETCDDNENKALSTHKEAAVFEQIGNVRRISVRPVNEDSEDSDAMVCLHGNDEISCTICTRPTGRCGREFKKKQDDAKRNRKRKKGGFKKMLKRITFGSRI